jgi:ABC-type multidrug transport system fused ATPase/permease subunit
MKSERQTTRTKSELPLANWPTDGSITFENVTVTSPNAMQALDGMSFRIETGQKIGELSLYSVRMQIVKLEVIMRKRL